MEMIPFRNPLGKPPKYTPEGLMEKFQEFLQWCKDNPIRIVRRTTYANGNFAEDVEEKPRLVSLSAFELYAGVSERWWSELSKRKSAEDYAKVKADIKKMCESYQKEMATAGVFKENIISRLLGLADKKQVDTQVEFKFKFGGEE